MQSNINQYFRASKGGIVRPKEDIVHKKDAVVDVHVDDHRPNPFDILPIEMNQRIAELLDGDDSLRAFMWTCRSTHAAIEGNGRSFWRRRFLATFERPSQPKSNNEYKNTYLQRRLINFHLVTFFLGRSKEERACLEVVRDIIVESFSEAHDDAGAGYKSANLAYLIKIIEACPSLLSCIFDPNTRRPQLQHRQRTGNVQPDPLLQTIQVLLTSQLLKLDSELTPWGFPESQQQAYNFRKMWKKSGGLSLDMEWLLHQVNFWRYHMLREDEITLCHAYCQLDASEYPRYWGKQLTNHPQSTGIVGRHWKGSWAYLSPEEVEEIREYGPNETIQDQFCAESREFQDLELEFLDNGEETWPAVFEQYLGALSAPKLQHAKTRASKGSSQPDDFTWDSRSFRFGGSGSEAKQGFLADGWLNTLPSQNGVPGWQRLTMMKYFKDHNDDVDYSRGLWAYEGVVLPGGKIIVGRWWDPEDGSYSGPFILWCVDTPELLRQHEDETTSQQL
ncbi:hypothetical protein M409DRAFT_27873 [Zasmidium cellare ATCC 36951]|uniref:F-box domain-containing protein n=1 Tax=Zasmidium cellare ATCC 36951 TaxID=1080233 RepID=A0A6A6C3U7_ZASCE|nr:uncharacterized protein M409DRAFT_27873 [Zasmidium cellare ATCC 36951]KAF2161817.1 hypothetical protein M409DRAFT_27873 [Zasmidium cellare ATCC 36951]